MNTRWFLAGFTATLLMGTAPAIAQSPYAGRALAATCATCHGTDGRSAGNVPPSLAGQDKNVMVQQLRDFRDGKRPATIMHQQAKGYTDAQFELIAAYFANVKPASAPARAGGY
jgi:cytochrome subunit of sulfide dehydrogenase